MPKETPIAEALEATEAAESITGLETAPEPTPSVGHGTVADLLSRKKGDEKPPEKPDKAEKAKEKKLDDIDQALRDTLFKNKPRKAKEEPAKTAAKKGDDDSETTEPEEASELPAPAKVPSKPVKKAVVRDRQSEIAEQMADLERQRLELERQKLEMERARLNPKQEQPKPDDVSHLSSDERYELEVFNVMAKMDKAKYGELPSRFTEVAKATVQYKSKWEKDHLGELFDPEDAEHNDFFDRNQIKYDKREFRKAEHRLATEGESDPKVEQLEKTNRELMAKDKLRELEPVVADTWSRYVDAMVESIDSDLAKVAREHGRDRLIEEYPEEGREVVRAAEALGAVALEAHKLLNGDGLFAPIQGNRVHDRILDIIRRQEAMIPRQPADSRVDAEGRDFATWEQWANMSQQQQANHWHLGPEEIVDIVSRDLALRIKYEIERINKAADARNKRKADKDKPQEGATLKEKPQDRRSPSASPGSASKTTIDTSSKGAKPEEDKFGKIIRSALFPRAS